MFWGLRCFFGGCFWLNMHLHAILVFTRVSGVLTHTAMPIVFDINAGTHTCLTLNLRDGDGYLIG